MDAWRRAIAHVAAKAVGSPLPAGASVGVYFHPDRIHVDSTGRGERVIERLKGGAYLSQFVTGISSGGLTARPGGDRWRWESRIFGGAYDEADARERPIYGAIRLRDTEHPDGAGGALRFGSSWLELRAEALDRVTLCWPDSTFHPLRFGTTEHASDLLSMTGNAADPLDDYVEAHVHGGLLLERDVERLVLDPCFQGTKVEAAAKALPVALAWNEGRVLDVETLWGKEAYRGPIAVALARSIARHGLLDARRIGKATARGDLDPQLVKQVWHLVARFGVPAQVDSGAPPGGGH